jgi:hypothetical protein
MRNVLDADFPRSYQIFSLDGISKKTARNEQENWNCEDSGFLYQVKEG